MTTQLINPHTCQFLQSRAAVNFAVVDEYAALMEAETIFDPVQGIKDPDGQIYIWDGYHRGEAAKKSGVFLSVELREGTKADAEWAALAANITHGLRRTQNDLERIVKAALALKPDAADRELGRHCGVDHKTVARYRKELHASGEIPQMPTRTVARNGTAYQMQTARQTEISMPAQPEPPGRIPGPDATKPKATLAELERLVKDWLFIEQNHNDITAKNALEDGLSAPFGRMPVFNVLADYIELRRSCLRSDIRQACKNVLSLLQTPRPEQPVSVTCDHCGKTYPSDQIVEHQGQRLHTDCYYAAIPKGGEDERLADAVAREPETDEQDPEEADDNHPFQFYAKDRDRIIHAGLRLFSIDNLQIKEYTPPYTTVRTGIQYQNCGGTWKRFETFTSKVRLKDRIQELYQEPNVIFDNHL